MLDSLMELDIGAEEDVEIIRERVQGLNFHLLWARPIKGNRRIKPRKQ